MMLKTKTPLQDLVQLQRRYMRSVHLERDLNNPDGVLGYVITSRAQEVIARFTDSLVSGSSRAWTITGVYGTGKSSAAHFLAALCSNRKEELFKRSRQIIENLLPPEQAQKIVKNFQDLPGKGLIRAVVTARREPIHHTILRALYNGVVDFYQHQSGRAANILNVLETHVKQLDEQHDFAPEQLFQWIAEIHLKTGTGILLILDELGKVFEYAAQHPHRSDLYLLQQLAEYPSQKPEQGVFLFGLLHQAFSEYASQMSGIQFNEWAKVQGRFEDIPFAESTEQIMRLIGHSIQLSPEIIQPLQSWSKDWQQALVKWTDMASPLPTDIFTQTYPLHPLTAFVLPQLCQRYAQNERSLFTFLASSEPHALQAFLHAENMDDNFPTLKLAQVYDYFVESANVSVSAHALAQRWVEIQNRLADAQQLDQDSQLLLKTIAIFNLISLSGPFRARWNMVLSALHDNPVSEGSPEYKRWSTKLKKLIDKGFVSWWERSDELRIWQGSNFDIDKAVQAQLETMQFSTLDVFQNHCHLAPLVAQRHSYETGTLRYFERRYWDKNLALDALLKPDSEADGFIYYSLEPHLSAKLPAKTEDERPIVYLCNSEIESLAKFGQEYAALHAVSQTATALKTDPVARKEVDRRLALSQLKLQEQFMDVFHTGDRTVTCLAEGKPYPLKGELSLRQLLSHLCDQTYPKGLQLWNELLNRRELTTQGAKARKELIGYMLFHAGEAQLGIEGYGPERSMFESLLLKTGLYQQQGDSWTFGQPDKKSGVYSVWEYIKDYCLEATDSPRLVKDLFDQLQRPPFGVKLAPLPVLLTAVLLQFSDEISLFQDGTFVPILGIEHFELLFRHPQRFAVKSFIVEGLQASYFKEMREVLGSNQNKFTTQPIRNQTVLGLVTPLIRFVKKLPNYVLQTQLVSSEAKALRQVLLDTQDPARLLFVDLPQALGYSPITPADELSTSELAALKSRLVATLSELNKAYPELLRVCQEALSATFVLNGAKSTDTLRKELTRRVVFLKGMSLTEPLLARFVHAVADTHKEDAPWLESVAMVIADKPPREWKDLDIQLFKQALDHLKRRFQNVEALNLELTKQPSNQGKEAKRVVVTNSSGKESQRIVWIDAKQKSQAQALVADFLKTKELKNNLELQEAFLAALTEQLFDI